MPIAAIAGTCSQYQPMAAINKFLILALRDTNSKAVRSSTEKRQGRFFYAEVPELL